MLLPVLLYIHVNIIEKEIVPRMKPQIGTL